MALDLQPVKKASSPPMSPENATKMLDLWPDDAASAAKPLDLQPVAKKLDLQPVSKSPSYGTRADGTQKGSGFFGELKRPDGDISTEISIGINIGGKEMEVPALVPTLTQQEIDHLLAGNKPTGAIVQKAAEHAKQRIAAGQSPFAGAGEAVKKLDIQPVQKAAKPENPDKRILANEPGYEYGGILPFKKNVETGEVSAAIPEIIRSPIRGVQDLVAAAKIRSTDMTDDAVNAALLVSAPALGRAGKGVRPVAKAAEKPPAEPLPQATKVYTESGAELNQATKAAAKPAPEVVVKPPTRAQKLAESAQNIFSPTSAGPGAQRMETLIREEQGGANRQTMQAETTLDKSSRLASTMDRPQQMEFYRAVENPVGKVKLADPSIKKFADDTRTVMQDVRRNIETLPNGDDIGFYQDYFPHMWKNPERARQFVDGFVSKQGSGANLKKRKYPTIEDGLAAGLELAEPNPVKAASRYVNSMNNYIASRRIVEEAKRLGDAKYFPEGGQPEGWVPLIGRGAEKPGMRFLGEGETYVRPKKLYAPPDVARIYNNTYKAGLEQTVLAEPFEMARTMTAANTAAELSLSGYHAATITIQSLFNDMSRVFKNAAVGDWKGVGEAAKSATVGQLPFVKDSTYKIGSKVLEQYKGLKDYGVNLEEIATHFEKGGGRVGQHKLYRGSELGGFWQAFRRGQLPEVTAGLKEKATSGVAGPANAAMEVLGRAAEDVAYPLFEHYIPRVKMGAFANLMGDWVRQNPKATPKEIAAARKQFVDLVDDRFGEMNMDNIFWPKLQKQVASLFLRAQGWDIGLVRQSGGGVLDTARIAKDAVTGKGFNKALLDRPAFLAAAITGTAMINAAYQYMKTGKPPEEMLDYMAPQTGGTNPSGAPERVMLPGHGKEMIHMMTPQPGQGPLSGITQEMSNKLASFPRNMAQAWNNEDFRGDPIGELSGEYGWAGSLPARVGHVAGGFLPFAMTEEGDPRAGTNLNWGERRLLGMRPAGMAKSEGERMEYLINKVQRREWRKKMLHDARKENQKEE